MASVSQQSESAGINDLNIKGLVSSPTTQAPTVIRFGAGISLQEEEFGQKLFLGIVLSSSISDH